MAGLILGPLALANAGLNYGGGLLIGAAPAAGITTASCKVNNFDEENQDVQEGRKRESLCEKISRYSGALLQTAGCIFGAGSGAEVGHCRFKQLKFGGEKLVSGTPVVPEEVWMAAVGKELVAMALAASGSALQYCGNSTVRSYLKSPELKMQKEEQARQREEAYRLQREQEGREAQIQQENAFKAHVLRQQQAQAQCEAEEKRMRPALIQQLEEQLTAQKKKLAQETAAPIAQQPVQTAVKIEPSAPAKKSSAPTPSAPKKSSKKQPEVAPFTMVTRSRAKK